MFSSVFFQLIERKTMLCERQKITVMQKLERLGDTDYIKKKKSFSFQWGFRQSDFAAVQERENNTGYHGIYVIRQKGRWIDR